MDIKDVQPPKSADSADGARPAADRKLARIQPFSIKPASLRAASGQAVNIDVATPQATNAVEIRGRANQVLGVVNVAAEAAAEIEKLVKGIEGIVGQAERFVSQGDAPLDARVPLLEREARQLVDAIRNRASIEAPNGVRPLAGDKIRLELEEKLGRSLEVLLPEAATGAFGIKDVSLSTKDSILNARANVAEAREQIQEIRAAIDGTFKEVQSIVSELEVALQNSEAARASIRDVDQALQVVDETSRRISINPQSALGAVGLGPAALNLLKV